MATTPSYPYNPYPQKLTPQEKVVAELQTRLKKLQETATFNVGNIVYNKFERQEVVNARIVVRVSDDNSELTLGAICAGSLTLSQEPAEFYEHAQ